MRNLVVLAQDRTLVARVAALLPSGWRVEALRAWPDVVRRLISEHPPHALLFTSDHLNDTVRRSVVELRKRRCFVPAAAYLGDATLSLAHFAGSLERHGVAAIFGAAELGRGLADLLDHAAPELGRTLGRMLEIADGVGVRLLALLDREPAMASAPPAVVARALRASRSALYRGLQSTGLPPVGEIQALFRLWPGLLRIHAGGRGEDAAFEAGRPHYPAFRKAVAKHLGLSIDGVRRAAGTRGLLLSWARWHLIAGPADFSERPAAAPRRAPRARRVRPTRAPRSR